MFLFLLNVKLCRKGNTRGRGCLLYESNEFESISQSLSQIHLVCNSFVLSRIEFIFGN